MKKLWLVLLMLVLLAAFSTSAMAVDVQSSGEFYAGGMYQDKTSFTKSLNNGDPSTAIYFQRLRLKTTFVVHPGLYLVTRADIMERAWGAARATGNRGTAIAGSDPGSSGTSFENENIAFDLAYVTYISPYGILNVGYQDDGAWGTVFGNSTVPLAKAVYVFVKGPFAASAYIAKFKESSRTMILNSNAADRDFDMYCVWANYTFKQGAAGLLFKHFRSAATRGLGFKQQFTAAVPYVKATFGPVAVQAELTYMFGDYMKFDDGVGGTDVKLDNLAGWIDATADFGVAYVGGSAAYIAGDDKGTADKKEGGVITGGTDWNPCLILFNFDRYYWLGKTAGYDGTSNPNGTDNPYQATNEGGMTNAWFLQGRVGVRPVEKLDIMLSVSWAHADKTLSTQWESREYGYEVDLIGVYKITNNLSYMLGGGYLFTGDWFKGINASGTNEVVNNYLVLNKLTLTF